MQLSCRESFGFGSTYITIDTAAGAAETAGARAARELEQCQAVAVRVNAFVGLCGSGGAGPFSCDAGSAGSAGTPMIRAASAAACTPAASDLNSGLGIFSFAAADEFTFSCSPKGFLMAASESCATDIDVLNRAIMEHQSGSFRQCTVQPAEGGDVDSGRALVFALPFAPTGATAGTAGAPPALDVREAFVALNRASVVRALVRRITDSTGIKRTDLVGAVVEWVTRSTTRRQARAAAEYVLEAVVYVRLGESNDSAAEARALAVVLGELSSSMAESPLNVALANGDGSVVTATSEAVALFDPLSTSPTTSGTTTAIPTTSVTSTPVAGQVTCFEYFSQQYLSVAACERQVQLLNDVLGACTEPAASPNVTCKTLDGAFVLHSDRCPSDLAAGLNTVVAQFGRGVGPWAVVPAAADGPFQCSLGGYLKVARGLSCRGTAQALNNALTLYAEHGEPFCHSTTPTTSPTTTTTATTTATTTDTSMALGDVTCRRVDGLSHLMIDDAHDYKCKRTTEVFHSFVGTCGGSAGEGTQGASQGIGAAGPTLGVTAAATADEPTTPAGSAGAPAASLWCGAPSAASARPLESRALRGATCAAVSRGLNRLVQLMLQDPLSPTMSTSGTTTFETTPTSSATTTATSTTMTTTSATLTAVVGQMTCFTYFDTEYVRVADCERQAAVLRSVFGSCVAPPTPGSFACKQLGDEYVLHSDDCDAELAQPLNSIIGRSGEGPWRLESPGAGPLQCSIGGYLKAPSGMCSVATAAVSSAITQFSSQGGAFCLPTTPTSTATTTTTTATSTPTTSGTIDPLAVGEYTACSETGQLVARGACGVTAHVLNMALALYHSEGASSCDDLRAITSTTTTTVTTTTTATTTTATTTSLSEARRASTTAAATVPAEVPRAPTATAAVGLGSAPPTSTLAPVASTGVFAAASGETYMLAFDVRGAPCRLVALGTGRQRFLLAASAAMVEAAGGLLQLSFLDRRDLGCDAATPNTTTVYLVLHSTISRSRADKIAAGLNRNGSGNKVARRAAGIAFEHDNVTYVVSSDVKVMPATPLGVVRNATAVNGTEGVTNATAATTLATGTIAAADDAARATSTVADLTLVYTVVPIIVFLLLVAALVVILRRKSRQRTQSRKIATVETNLAVTPPPPPGHGSGAESDAGGVQVGAGAGAAREPRATLSPLWNQIGEVNSNARTTGGSLVPFPFEFKPPPPPTSWRQFGEREIARRASAQASSSSGGEANPSPVRSQATLGASGLVLPPNVPAPAHMPSVGADASPEPGGGGNESWWDNSGERLVGDQMLVPSAPRRESNERANALFAPSNKFKRNGGAQAPGITIGHGAANIDFVTIPSKASGKDIGDGAAMINRALGSADSAQGASAAGEAGTGGHQVDLKHARSSMARAKNALGFARRASLTNSSAPPPQAPPMMERPSQRAMFVPKRQNTALLTAEQAPANPTRAAPPPPAGFAVPTNKGRVAGAQNPKAGDKSQKEDLSTPQARRRASLNLAFPGALPSAALSRSDPAGPASSPTLPGADQARPVSAAGSVLSAASPGGSRTVTADHGHADATSTPQPTTPIAAEQPASPPAGLWRQSSHPVDSDADDETPAAFISTGDGKTPPVPVFPPRSPMLITKAPGHHPAGFLPPNAPPPGQAANDGGKPSLLLPKSRVPMRPPGPPRANLMPQAKLSGLRFQSPNAIFKPATATLPRSMLNPKPGAPVVPLPRQSSRASLPPRPGSAKGSLPPRPGSAKAKEGSLPPRPRSAKRPGSAKGKVPPRPRPGSAKGKMPPPPRPGSAKGKTSLPPPPRPPPANGASFTNV